MTPELNWTKSSYSSNDGPDCVEVATAAPAVHVRDSKDVNGARLTFAGASWARFLAFAAGR
jgi:hypothetical protein